MGVKIYKTPYQYGVPIEYILPSTQQTFALNQLAKMGSTAVGLQYADGTTNFTNGLFLTLKATTGSSQELVPVHRVSRDILYIVPLCSSETVVSTTLQGQCISISSSGGAVASSTGGFKITTVCATSANTSEYFIGTFPMIAATTN